MAFETVVVLGGGSSALEHDLNNLKKIGFVIGVNDASIHAEVGSAVTMDRTWFEHRWQKIKDKDISFFAREEAVVNVAERWSDLHIFACDRLSTKMSDDPCVLNGLNSGFCALNLAFKLRPAKVMAIGFDCSRTGYWYPPYPWQTAEKPKGMTSDWAFDKWKSGLEDIKAQFKTAGIEWI